MNKVLYQGRIEFAPAILTRKHKKQSDWKNVAMVLLPGDICEYYAWFIKRRYRLRLEKPIRGAHVTFINDATESIEDWDAVSKKHDGKQIILTFDADAKTDGKHWWLTIPKEHRSELQGIRSELGLGEPFWSFHMSIGYANEKFLNHAKYIHEIVR